jgi:transposase
LKEDAPQREYPLRELLNALRWIVRTGWQWRFLPKDLPPWSAVNQQAGRWMKAGCFEAMAADLREILRAAQGRAEQPSAVICR